MPIHLDFSMLEHHNFNSDILLYLEFVKPHMKRKLHPSTHDQLPLPSDTSLQKIAESMEKQLREKEHIRKYAPIHEILAILSKGVMISSVILAPGTAKALAPLLRQTPDYDAWKHYNPSYLRRSLR